MISAVPIRTKDQTVIQVEMRDARGHHKCPAEQLSLDETEALAFKLLDLVEENRDKSRSSSN